MTMEHQQRINVTPKLDSRLFAVFALANAVGYNMENGWEFGPVRREVRCRLARGAARWRTALESLGILPYVQRGGASKLMDLAPQLASPPDFAPLRSCEYRVRWQTEWTRLQGIEATLADFVRHEPILEMWSEFKPAYEEEASHFSAAGQHLARIAALFAEPSDVDVVLLPNLLDARGRGYSASSASQSWLYFGPMRNARQAEEVAVHELLHRYIDHACEKRWQQEPAPTPDPMPLATARFRIVADLYSDFQIWVGETIVRAMTVRLVPDLEYVEESPAEALLAYYERIGFLGVVAIHELLVQTPEQAFPDVIDECITQVRNEVLKQCA